MSFSKLGDVRVKYAEDVAAQNFILNRCFPDKYDQDAAREYSDWDENVQVRPQTINSVEAAIVVMRHLFTFVGPAWRDGSDGNPLEAMIWADLADDENVKEQTMARYAIIKKFYEEDPDNTLDFFSLTECEAMWDSVWKRRPFLFWHPLVLQNVKENKWEVVEYKVPRKLARVSRFQYRGDGTLSDFISKGLGQFWNEESQAKYYWQIDNPVIIRVYYDHKPAYGPPKGFDELNRLSINPKRLKKVGEDKMAYYREETQRMEYQLVAVVRLAGEDDGDRIRLYGDDGKSITLPSSLGRRFGGTEWRLGEVDAKYMLYYALSRPGQATGVVPREVEPVIPGARATLYRMLNAVDPERYPDEVIASEDESS
ncbi:hypothetical protein F5Y04DRAFT_292683 [Hypomontagnella monticulosa]|nr:hypothetical protein F5Y04DRAFT_292683 [Hypomontagnella monticulosa]